MKRLVQVILLLVLTGTHPELMAQQTPPFEILVIGDGLVFGQGFRDDQKLSLQVANFLKAKLPGREVHVHTFAHAGAQIPLHEDDEKLHTPGNVPLRYPSVTWQVARAASELGGTITRRYVPSIHPQVSNNNVALVLLSGGLSDVGMKRLLTPDPTDIAIRQAAQTLGVARMKTLLTTVAATFPNAKIVVLNYWPLISTESDPARVLELLQHWKVGIDKVDATVMDRLVRQSNAFHEETSRGFREAIAAVNQSGMKAIAKLSAPDPSRQTRATLADVPFAPGNAYAGKSAFLFQLFEPDPALPVRAEQCLAVHGSIDEQCKFAATAYPNARGAAAYASVVIGALQRILPELGGGRIMSR